MTRFLEKNSKKVFLYSEKQIIEGILINLAYNKKDFSISIITYQSDESSMVQ